ncbi:Retron-type RNA-directed DNA polymerase [Bacillus sp. L_1B0_8]|uniref:Retron-type RNA-directed DNA polymerase n=1 Tax=Bacillus thuringiensis subsp. higo TaxID=132266 RepID=A0A9X6LH81_BACUH|nr:Retron-type RNA-directed DNA polymerase [Bacillus cereus]KIQ89014.1 Retron-type RNA-directed DNA polymerase [Bacillus sp. L_1B0_5]KIQ92688.1 Retron-type RNA-directed DNA polymerase [Bacillus sp. L_1B0_8]OUB44872.1 Retron-type RNA-directed DNA polymerase [Bacillus thuringiensis serovar higo]MBX9157794.1 Retron-type RNA-directed DNA polymerase [Bacillus cereus]
MSQVLIFLWTWLFLWKMRKLGIPTVVDRLVQQAISQVLGSIFEKQFSESSYGFRQGLFYVCISELHHISLNNKHGK